METKFKPNYIIHPGVFLLDEMKLLKISQKDLAEKVGISKTIINEVIHGKRNMNADFAVRLERVLESPASYWLNLQALYDEAVARIKLTEQEKQEDSISALNSFVIISNDICLEDNRKYYSYHVRKKCEGVA